jgi:hypothetical protein
MNTMQIQLQLQLDKLTALLQEVFTRDNVKQITTENVHKEYNSVLKSPSANGPYCFWTQPDLPSSLTAVA